MSAYRIRAAEPADAALLSRWAQAMAMETEHRRLDASIVDAGVAAGIADASKARYFIAMQDAPVAGRETIGSAIGTLMLTREWSDWRNGDWWWIQSVYVVPDRRGLGVFRAMHDHIFLKAKADPRVCGIRLYVERENRKAQAVYHRVGLNPSAYTVYEQDFVLGHEVHRK